MQKTIPITLSLCLIFFTLNAQDTFSIVAADPDTGEIGAAGASCVDGAASIGGVHIISKLIPNRGGINAQAWICVNPHVNLDNGILQMITGSSPDEIIQYLQENDECFSQNYNPEYRQYGIVDFDGNGGVRTAGFTGNSADNYKGHILGPNYAIQGNILLGPEILEQIEQGFINTEGSLAEKLMAAIQGANVAGADARCLDRGTSSTSAFLKVTKPDDDFLQPSLFLNIEEMPFGVEPIDSLQNLFDEWFTSSIDPLFSSKKIKIFPNPSSDKINLQIDQVIEFNRIEVYNNFGQLIRTFKDKHSGLELISIDISDLTIGAYIIKIKNDEDLIGIEKVIRI